MGGSPDATSTGSESADDSIVAALPRMVLRGARVMRPLAVYERIEALSAVAAATAVIPPNPIGMLRAVPAMRRWGGNPAGIVVAGARQHPNFRAIIDDDEVVTSAELDRRTNALARELLARRVGVGSTVGIFSHNRALVLYAEMAAYKVGAAQVSLNTGFSAAQVGEVVIREGIDLLICDASAAAIVTAAGVGASIGPTEVWAAFADRETEPVTVPTSVGPVVVLTSGTTGAPKGARRAGTGSAWDAASILTCIPFAARDTTIVAAPLFHGLGLFNANLALALGSTLILRERFTPEQALEDIQEHHATGFVAVPAMLQRIMALPPKRLDTYDCSSLRIVVSGGAALSGSLADRFMDHFGEVLYNIYGSTETALATIASPAELRRAPGTAGRPTPGVSVRVLDDYGQRVRPGVTGRIFVGSRLRFDGYTGGGGKEAVGGLLATGDVGYFDRLGRLFIAGRDDEMIISGGENVYPAEIEETLLHHPTVAEAAVIGVTDDEYGQRLIAFVVRKDGTDVDQETLKQYVRDKLARFKIPREVVFLDRLPHTGTGKVIKRELASGYASARTPE